MSTDRSSKRDRILDQAIATFAEVGFRRADVQVIADRADVGKGTVYRSFGNKEQLFWAALCEVLDRLEKHVVAAMDPVTDPVERLRSAGRAFGRFFDLHPACLEVFAQDRAEFRGQAPVQLQERHQRLLDRIGTVLDEGIAAGKIRQTEVRRTMLLTSAALYGCVLYPSFTREKASLEQISQRMMDVLLEGIARR